MSDPTESSNNDTPASDYYEQSIDAAHRGEFEYAEELCRKAAKLYEQAGEDEVAKIYCQLGRISNLLTCPNG
jgi:hypothetical protein